MSGETHLEITEGLHVGASIRLAPGRVTVGADLGCDVVLCDADVAPHHFDILVADGRLEIVARDAAVTVGGNADVQPGFRARTYERTTVRLGAVAMALSCPSVPMRPAPRQAGRIAAALAMVVAISLAQARPTADAGMAHADPAVASLSASPDVGAPSQPDPRAGSERLLDAVLEMPPDGARPSRPPIETRPTATRSEPWSGRPDRPAQRREDAARAAAVELMRRGLDDVTIEVRAGALVLRGEVGADRREDWSRFQVWFDANHAGIVLRTDGIRFDMERSHPRPPRIRSVWRIGTPYAVIGDGRYSEGQALPGGWTLVEIRQADLLMSHEGEVFEIPLDGASGGADG